MLYYFPPLLPDEKLSHGWARYVERVGHTTKTKKNAFWELFGEFDNSIRFRTLRFESYIDAFASNLPDSLPYTSDYLIGNHTLYPLYSFTMFRSQAERFKLTMNGHEGFWRGTKLFTKPSIRVPQFVRYCVECAKEDIKFYGETYWHRLHQIPDIDVCIDHHCWLENTVLGYKNRSEVMLMTARQYVDLTRSPKYCKYRNGNYEYVQLQLARIAKYFLNHPSYDLYLEEMREIYKRRLFEMGFSTPKGVIYQWKLEDFIYSKIQPNVLQKLQEDLYGFRKVWNKSLVPDDTVTPPTIHFLSMYFLDMEPKYFVEHSTEIKPFAV